MKRLIALVLAVDAVTAAWAQGAAPVAPKIGSLSGVNGLVTVAQGNLVTNGVNGLPLFDGMRIVSSSTGAALIKLDNGCDIPLAPNQAVVIQTGKPCAALLASVHPVPAAAAGAAVAAGGANPALIGVGALLLLGGAGGGGGGGGSVSGQ